MLSYYLSLLESSEEQQLFTELYTENHDHIEKLVLSLLGHNRDDAEDALQNTFVQVIRHFDTVLRIPREERPYWLRVVAKNEAKMILRSNRRTVAVEDETFFDKAVEAEDSLAYSELVSFFARLPDTYREALEMKLLLQYSGKEIADHLGVSETVIHTRISRGKALLRAILEKEGYR